MSLPRGPPSTFELSPDTIVPCYTVETMFFQYTFLVQLDLPSSIKIEGGNLAGPYKAMQLHLHWGKEGGPGSEHTIDGEQFPMEV